MNAEGTINVRADHVGLADVRPTSLARRLGRSVAEAAPVVIDLYRFVHKPGTQMHAWADSMRWRRDLKSVRSLTSPASDAPTALLISYSDQIFDVKMRCAVATALRLDGWRVVALVRTGRSIRAFRLYRAAGVTEFLVDDSITNSEADVELCRKRSAEMMEGALTFDQVRGWSFRGAWIGPQLLASASRALLEGHPDPSDPEVRAVIASLLPEMLLRVIRAEKILQEVDAKIGVLDEYNYTVAAPIVDLGIARGMDFITLRQLFRDDAFIPTRLTSATRRIHHAAVFPDTMDELRSRPWTPVLEEMLAREFDARYDHTRAATSAYQGSTSAFDSSELVAMLDIDPSKKTGVVFSHVLWDANLFYGEDLFDDFGDWLGQTVRHLATRDDMNWLIKLHPANLAKQSFHGSKRVNEYEIIERYTGSSSLPPHMGYLVPDTPISTLSLYQFADVGVTVRGTPGIEMPCFGKPVITAGTGRYEGYGFTVDSRTTAEYFEKLDDAGGLTLSPSAVIDAKRHALALFVLRDWRSSTFKVEHGVRWTDRGLNISVVDDPLMGTDLRRLSEWIDGRSPGYCEWSNLSVVT